MKKKIKKNEDEIKTVIELDIGEATEETLSKINIFENTEQNLTSSASWFY